MEKLCIDPRDLIRSILPEHFPLKTVDEVIIQIRDASVFTRSNMFWQLKLAEQSTKLYTFNTSYGM